MAAVEELRRRFRHSADDQRPRAPFSASICDVVAEEPSLVELLTAAPEEQQLPVLFLAALHDDVLREPDTELAAFYPTVSSSPRADGLRDALLRHCDARADTLAATIAGRVTQTNEVGRCGFLLPALGLVAGECGPLALIDIGTSAGLNLRPDRYEYHYRPGGPVGGPSGVRLDVATRGPVPVPREVPGIADRVGVDRDPIDVTNDDDARWLRACVWPDQTDRFERLDAAIEIARADPHPIHSAPANDGLEWALAAIEPSAHAVIVNTWVLCYLRRSERREYVATLDRAGSRRDLTWIFAESPGQAAGLPFPDELAGQHLTALVLVRWRDGERTVDHLGVTHPHGYWLHWRDA